MNGLHAMTVKELRAAMALAMSMGADETAQCIQREMARRATALQVVESLPDESEKVA